MPRRRRGLSRRGGPPSACVTRPWNGAAIALLSTGLAFGLYWFTAASGLTWAHDGADGGDLLAAALTGGVPHPSGYPLYTALLQGWLRMGQALAPSAEAARLGNLFSAGGGAQRRCDRACGPLSDRPGPWAAGNRPGDSPALDGQPAPVEPGADHRSLRLAHAAGRVVGVDRIDPTATLAACRGRHGAGACQSPDLCAAAAGCGLLAVARIRAPAYGPTGRAGAGERSFASGAALRASPLRLPAKAARRPSIGVTPMGGKGSGGW